MAAIALAVGATRKPRRKMGRYIRGNVNEVLSLGTLASLTLVADTFDDTVTERALISSIVAAYSLENFTVAAGSGPIIVGVAHGDYSAAEIEAYIENSQGWQEGDLVAREVGARKIRILGVFRAAPGGGLGAATLQEGRKIKTKLNWILNAGQTLDLWAYNSGTVAVGTTVPVIRAEGHVNLWPR